MVVTNVYSYMCPLSSGHLSRKLIVPKLQSWSRNSAICFEQPIFWIRLNITVIGGIQLLNKGRSITIREMTFICLRNLHTRRQTGSSTLSLNLPLVRYVYNCNGNNLNYLTGLECAL